MEAGSRLWFSRFVTRRISITLIAGLLALLVAAPSQAANFRTQNFLIQAPSPQLAQAVGNAAEKYRRELAMYWLGSEIRPWRAPCPIRVIAGPTLAAQGVTTYNRAPVGDFQMEVVGTPERILDSVLPHEVTHTILATHFGRPLPRWADEGICTTVEHAAEKSKHEAKLREFLRTRRGIAMNQLFLLTEYPSDVLPMYAQGYSVCRFLIDQQGPRTFIQFLHDYMQRPSWTASIQKHYGYDSLAELQDYWLAWVAAGSGPVEKFVKADAKTSPAGSLASAVSGAAPSGLTPPANSVALAGSTSRSDSMAPSESAAPSGPAGNAVVPAANAVAGSFGRVLQPAAGASNLNATPQTPNVNGTALASTVSQGWYQRRREETKASGATANPEPDSSGPIRAIAPPSVTQSGPYSVSQPQDEQQMSRGGIPLAGSRGYPRSSVWR